MRNSARSIVGVLLDQVEFVVKLQVLFYFKKIKKRRNKIENEGMNINIDKELNGLFN